MSSLVSLEQLCVEFDDRRVLDNISMELEKGKITTLIGPNGAGKSTLVKVILGLQKPTSGKLVKAKKLKNWLCASETETQRLFAAKRYPFLKFSRKVQQTRMP